MIGAPALVLIALVFGAMLAEAWYAARNERLQRARGGIEPSGDVFPIMRIAYPACFLAMIAESITAGGIADRDMFAGGAALFAAAKALKYWAIASLRQSWTFRVIVVPGAPLVSSGPYRHLRHPNYVAVAGELGAVALMTAARWTGPIALVCFSLLMWRRARVEQRALDAILPRS